MYAIRIIENRIKGNSISIRGHDMYAFVATMIDGIKLDDIITGIINIYGI